MKLEQTISWLYFAHSIALAPSFTLLAGFVVWSLLAVPLSQLANTEEGSSWEYGSAWYQHGTLHKYLGTQD